MAHELVALDEVSRVSDQELITRLRRLVRDDQALHVRLLVHLGEVDARGLYREHAYGSMFTYCVEELRMSEAQAYLRIQAARSGRQFPRVLQLLAEGTVNLTAIKLLGRHLTADNHVDLLERACGKRKREVELLVAEIAPKPDVPNRMRKLPAPSSSRATRLQAELAPTSVEARQAAIVARQTLDAPEGCEPMRGQPSLESSTVTPSRDGSDVPVRDVPVDGARDANRALFALEAPRQRGSLKPLSPGRYKVEFTAGQALHDKLAQLRDLLRHQVPDGELAVLFERAVDSLIEDTLKQRFAQTRAAKKPRSAKRMARACDPSRGKAVTTEAPTLESPTGAPRRPREANSRYIPRAVVREVYQRDAGQCTFVSSEGKRCSERSFLELHHHDPYARGGEPTVENLRLVCRAHNSFFAERDYGRAFMRSKQKQTREPSDELAPGTVV